MSAEPMRARMDLLERTVMELGSELYAMRSAQEKNRAGHDQFLSILKGLKQLLDEKGLITHEDFDAAVELGEAIERFNTQNETAQIHAQHEKAKKAGH